MDKERDISKEDLFFCYKNCYFNDSKNIIFKKGEIYKSFRDGCIEDENSNKWHYFTKAYWTQYLIKLDPLKEFTNFECKRLGDKLKIMQILIHYKKHKPCQN